jgi:hypothetical protein
LVAGAQDDRIIAVEIDQAVALVGDVEDAAGRA